MRKTILSLALSGFFYLSLLCLVAAAAVLRRGPGRRIAKTPRYVPDNGNNLMLQYEIGNAGRLVTLVPSNPAATGPSPMAAAASPDGNHLYVSNSQGASVSQFRVGVTDSKRSHPRRRPGGRKPFWYRRDSRWKLSVLGK